jgi:ribosomal protein S27E
MMFESTRVNLLRTIKNPESTEFLTVLKCPNCDHIMYTNYKFEIKCEDCDYRIKIEEDNIVEVLSLEDVLLYQDNRYPQVH